jgi:hypothetical protein
MGVVKLTDLASVSDVNKAPTVTHLHCPINLRQDLMVSLKLADWDYSAWSGDITRYPRKLLFSIFL